MYSIWFERHGIEDFWVQKQLGQYSTKDRSQIFREATTWNKRTIACQTETEDRNVEIKIAALTGKHTFRRHNEIDLCNGEYLEDRDEAIKQAKAGKVAVTGNPHLTYRDARDDEYAALGDHVGVLAKSVSWYWEFTYDLDRWNKIVETHAKAEKKKRENPSVNVDTFSRFAQQLASNMSMPAINNFKGAHLLAWIYAHDTQFGRRKTNKEIKWLAKAWSKHPKRYRDRYKRYMNDSIVDGLEERFKKIVKFPAKG